ncbi:MAG TPA: PAS domain-containing sensor histidine kinase [Candidatus Dormibacteraeota bacterium]|nr:PAS domain-containing sensor histidine kinase [Candidatus Dormibacteraeota bacterium]
MSGETSSEPSTRRAGERGHDLVDLAFDAMFVRSFRDRIITYWNDGAQRLYGWSRQEAIGLEPAKLLGSIYPIPLEAIENELERSGRWEGEIVQRRKDGHMLTVRARWGLQTDAAGGPEAILEINSDISREKRATDELSQSEERFALLVSAVVDYAIFMLDPEGRVVTWNQGAQRIKGYSEEEIKGRHFSIFYAPDDVASGKPGWVLDQAVRNGHHEDEGWRVRKDGSRFWASVVVTALRDRDGVLRGFAKVTRDVTDRRNAEQRRNAERDREAAQLRARAEQMAELERMKTEFLNLASHELRGPLAVVRGYNWMLRDGVVGGDEVPEIARIVEPKLAQIHMLVEQMLEAARLEADRLELDRTTFDLVDVASEQARAFASMSDGRSVDVVKPNGAVRVSADRGRIATVVGNLMDNALKYSPADRNIEVTVGEDDGYAFVAVRDFGVGIAAEHLPLLFQRFSRLPTEQNVTVPGTGLGLFLCQQIAARHGGSIGVESAPGEGSEFTLRLPTASTSANDSRA